MKVQYTADELIQIEKDIGLLFENKRLGGPVHLSGGNENALIHIFKNHVKAQDWIVSTHRYHYHYLLAGGDRDSLITHLEGSCTMSLIDRGNKFYSTAIVGGGIPIAIGLARALTGTQNRCICFIGDAACDSGRIMAALRYADSYELPVLFVIEDNELSCDVPTQSRWGTSELPKYLTRHPRVFYYTYKRTVPHVGTGKFIQF